MNNLVIRNVDVEDAKQILDIYSYYILGTAITFELDIPSLDEFKDRIINIKKRYPYVCLELNNKIIGYAYANVFKDRRAYDHSVETTIYIDKDYRRFGYGRILYLELEKRLKEIGIKNLYACIGSPIKEDEYLDNTSMYFHKSLGYELIGRFHKCGYKFNKWYDMIWMEKLIADHN